MVHPPSVFINETALAYAVSLTVRFGLNCPDCLPKGNSCNLCRSHDRVRQCFTTRMTCWTGSTDFMTNGSNQAELNLCMRKSGNTDMVPLKTVLEIMTVFLFWVIVLSLNLHFKIIKFKNKDCESFCQGLLEHKKHKVKHFFQSYAQKVPQHICVF